MEDCTVVLKNAPGQRLNLRRRETKRGGLGLYGSQRTLAGEKRADFSSPTLLRSLLSLLLEGLVAALSKTEEMAASTP